MKPWRRLGLVFLALFLSAWFGGVHARRVEATTDAADSDVQNSFRAFTKVYEVVEQNYAEPVQPDKAIYGTPNTDVGAIPGMLRALDPHSSFFDPRAFTELREQMQGKYYGVGMRIQSRPGRLGKLVTVVVLPIPGSPAFRVGLRPGDIIIAVNGKPTGDLSSVQVADLLKGPKGTVARVSVSREGADQPLEFTIRRDEISPRSVDVFMIRPGIAYIHIIGFTETSNDELTAALRKSDPGRLRGMILDLRNNPGGLLQQGVEITDHFLPKHQLIVYHYGRRSREKCYYVSKGNKGNGYPMVVLINGQTASAAEIVAGALQDHDRALVMGEPSFGKGLVQSEFPLSERTMLLLTTARYYTPSGRLIQRDYANVSLYDYYYRWEPPRHTEVRLTDGGRQVYGGGGITPDVQVPDEGLNPTQEKLRARDAFFNFAKSYLGIYKTVPFEFRTTDEVIEEFQRFLEREKIAISEPDLKQNFDFIKDQIRFQLIRAIYGETEADRISVEADPLVLKALDSLDEAKQLMASAKQYRAAQNQR